MEPDSCHEVPATNAALPVKRLDVVIPFLSFDSILIELHKAP
jgi:hypothetical protein